MLVSDIPEFGANHYADRVAVVDGDRTLTYRRLAERCRSLASGLRAVAEPGERVAILSQNRSEFLEAYYGVPGGGFPLVFLNYRLHVREIVAIVADSGASIVLVEERYRADLAAALDEAGLACRLVVIGADGPDGYETLLAGGCGPVPAPQADDLAWIIYTSGTTGRPKGAMLTHRNLIVGVGSWMVDYGPRVRETYLMSFPLCHVAGSGVLGYHLRGNTVVVRQSFEPGDFLRQVATHGVTGTSMAPTMIGMVLDHPELPHHDVSSLGTITYGGSPISAALLRRAMETLPGVRFVQAFGMTELAGSVLCLDGPDHDRALAGEEGLLRSAGRPMTFSSVRIVDDDMVDVAPGETGEIVVRGDQVQVGYWMRPEETAASQADGWFRTGDLGRTDADGYVYIVDRKKDMIVTGGENVYSREVEHVIAGHPLVADVAVVGIPDERWGEAVCAVVVRRSPDLDADAVVAHCRASLAGYKRPRRVEFVDALPTNASGKVLKRTIRDDLVAG